MNLDEFQKVTISEFKGLYKRGNFDQVPQDHASDLANVDFLQGETFTRGGLAEYTLGITHPVKRMFLSSAIPGTGIQGTTGPYLITHDGNGTLYIFAVWSNQEWAYSFPGSVDFAAVNAFGRTYIMPVDDANNNNWVVQVWDGSNPLHPALGLAPRTTDGAFIATVGGAGNVTPGVHKLAISYISSTGFTTRPGPADANGNYVTVSVNSPANSTIVVTNLPNPPASLYNSAFQIYATKANENEFFYVASGYWPHNAGGAVSITLNFFDTDLAVSADSLFDLMESLPCGSQQSMGMYKYHGRVLSWGRQGVDLVLVSLPGEPESFDNTVGFIQLPTEKDAPYPGFQGGNYVKGAFELLDVLYLTKVRGIYSAQDNFGDPSTWPIVCVDGAVGSYYYSVSTMISSQTGGSVDAFVILADRGGIYIFNGVIQQPPITWKIRDLWNTLTADKEFLITIVTDPYEQIIYCLFPSTVAGQPDTTVLLVGTVNEGIDFQSVKWSVYTFPQQARTIGILPIRSDVDLKYRLRIGFDGGGLWRLDPNYDYDRDTNTTSGTAPIHTIFQSALIGFDFGKINVFRALVVRSEFIPSSNTSYPPSNLAVQLLSQDGANSKSAPSFNLPLPPTGREFTRQINYMAEKMMVRLTSQNKIKLDRLDIYGKIWFQSRPLLSSLNP